MENERIFLAIFALFITAWLVFAFILWLKIVYSKFLIKFWVSIIKVFQNEILPRIIIFFILIFFISVHVYFMIKKLFKPKIIKIKAKNAHLKQYSITPPLYSGEYANLNSESITIPECFLVFKDENNKEYQISLSLILYEDLRNLKSLFRKKEVTISLKKNLFGEMLYYNISFRKIT